ncbi:mariner Mos1 transposase [Trichonephila clavipes]|nr:mariner Mos1 transposase [Trichonephila clavipes]
MLYTKTRAIKKETAAQRDFPDDNAPNHRAKPTKDIVKALDWEPLSACGLFARLAPSDYHLFASLGRALADQRFTSYENVSESWLDDWLASKDRSFFGVVFVNCPKVGQNVYPTMDIISNKKEILTVYPNLLCFLKNNRLISYAYAWYIHERIKIFSNVPSPSKYMSVVRDYNSIEKKIYLLR